MNSVLNLIEREANNEPINTDDFTLLEMLGPVLQTSSLAMLNKTTWVSSTVECA